MTNKKHLKEKHKNYEILPHIQNMKENDTANNRQGQYIGTGNFQVPLFNFPATSKFDEIFKTEISNKNANISDISSFDLLHEDTSSNKIISNTPKPLTEIGFKSLIGGLNTALFFFKNIPM